MPIVKTVPVENGEPNAQLSVHVSTGKFPGLLIERQYGGLVWVKPNEIASLIEALITAATEMIDVIVE